MKTTTYVKIAAFLFSVLSVGCQAGGGISTDPEVVKAGIYEFMDKTMLNGKPAPAGSGVSVVYTMKSDEVCQFLSGDGSPLDVDMCEVLSSNVKIHQKVYSKTKGDVIWLYKSNEILKVHYSAQEEISYVLDIKAIYDTAADITNEFGATDAEAIIAQYFPKAGKFKVSALTPNSDRGVVKFEVIEALDHRFDVNGEEVHVKLATGNNVLVDVNKATKIATAALNLDGLEGFLPGPMNPMDQLTPLHLTNTKLSLGITTDINQNKITLNDFKSQSLLLQIGDNETVSLHSTQPISLSAVIGGYDIRVLKNNFNLTANVNTSLAPSQYQGAYSFALSKDDHVILDNNTGDLGIALNNVEIKGPTEFFKTLGAPLASGSTQTQFLAGKIATVVNLQSLSQIQDLELKDIYLKADATTLVNIDNDDKINAQIDTQFQSPIILSGLDHFKVHADTNFLNDVAATNLPVNDTIKLDIEKLNTEVNLSAGYNIKDTEIENLTFKIGNELAFSLDNKDVINGNIDWSQQTKLVNFSGVKELGIVTNTNIANGLLGLSLPPDETASIYIAGLNGQIMIPTDSYSNPTGYTFNNLRFNDGATTGVSKLTVAGQDVVTLTHTGNFSGSILPETGLILSSAQQLDINVANSSVIPVPVFGAFTFSNAADTQIMAAAGAVADTFDVTADKGSMNFNVNLFPKDDPAQSMTIGCSATKESGCVLEVPL